MRTEVVGDCRDALRPAFGQGGVSETPRADSGSQRSRDVGDCRGADWEAMVGAGSRGRWHRFDDVQTIHALGIFGPATRCKRARVRQSPWTKSEEVGIE